MLFDIWLLIQTAELFITPNSQLVDANEDNFDAQFKRQKVVV